MSGYTGSNGYYRDLSTGKVTYTENLSIGAGMPASYSARDRRITVFFPAYLIPKAVIKGPPSLVLDAAASNQTFSIYRQQADGVSYALKELNLGANNMSLPLVYSSLAFISAAYQDPADNILKTGASPIVYGLIYDRVTKLTNLGSRNYSGLLLGQASATGSSHVYELTGTVQFKIDFVTNRYTSEIHVSARDDKSGVSFDLGVLKFDESPYPRPEPDYFLGSISGAHSQAFLTGPAGEELVGGFDASIDDPQTPGVKLIVTGAYAAKR
ncbi:hypothetical protein ACG3SL_15605 [Sphingomonas sp. CJ20]